VVEDDDGIGGEVTAELDARGYSVTRVADGEAATTRALQNDYNLLVIDRLLPGIDGLEIVRRLREENLRTPVLVLSALGAVDDRVRGLKAGGDDYLTKPFALPELAARVEALLRRPVETRETILRAGDLVLDLIDREAHRNGRRIELLPREFKLLEYLMRRQGQALTRAMLLEDVWYYRFVPQTNLVDVHIGKLRRKLNGPGEPDLIESVWGSGFMLRVPEN
jgi:two-component system OmpR family response regulator